MVDPQTITRMNDKKESNPWKWVAIAISAIVIVITLWLLSWPAITGYLGKNPDTAGTFGDMFGAVNALFSGLAFAGIILAVLMQQEELKIQRKEVTQSRQAQETQGKALLIAAQLEANIALLQDNNIITITNTREHGTLTGQEFLANFTKERVLEIDNLRLELQKLTHVSPENPPALNAPGPHNETTSLKQRTP